MDSPNAALPTDPTTAHVKTLGKPPAYTYNHVSAADLESQNTQWTAPPPPAYWPGHQAPPVPVGISVQRRVQTRRQDRRGLCCCFFLAFLLVAIFVIVTIVEVVARTNYSNDINQ